MQQIANFYPNIKFNYFTPEWNDFITQNVIFWINNFERKLGINENNSISILDEINHKNTNDVDIKHFNSRIDNNYYSPSQLQNPFCSFKSDSVVEKDNDELKQVDNMLDFEFIDDKIHGDELHLERYCFLFFIF